MFGGFIAEQTYIPTCNIKTYIYIFRYVHRYVQNWQISPVFPSTPNYRHLARFAGLGQLWPIFFFSFSNPLFAFPGCLWVVADGHYILILQQWRTTYLLTSTIGSDRTTDGMREEGALRKRVKSWRFNTDTVMSSREVRESQQSAKTRITLSRLGSWAAQSSAAYFLYRRDQALCSISAALSVSLLFVFYQVLWWKFTIDFSFGITS